MLIDIHIEFKVDDDYVERMEVGLGQDRYERVIQTYISKEINNLLADEMGVDGQMVSYVSRIVEEEAKKNGHA